MRCAGAICYHSGNSSNFDKKFRQYLCFRNRYFLLLKNDIKKTNFLSLLVYDIPRFFFLLLSNNDALELLKEVIYTKRSNEIHKICS